MNKIVVAIVAILFATLASPGYATIIYDVSSTEVINCTGHQAAYEPLVISELVRAVITSISKAVLPSLSSRSAILSKCSAPFVVCY